MFNQKRELYVLLRGRIGNQLFIHAFCEALRRDYGSDTDIIFDTSEVDRMGWRNSLPDYDLNNVKYVSSSRRLKTSSYIVPYLAMLLYNHIVSRLSFARKFQFEQSARILFEFLGLIACENGFMKFRIRRRRNLVVGYFQSPRYFEGAIPDVKQLYDISKRLPSVYRGLADQLWSSNAVCISVKVEHNVGNTLYAVCGKEYWESAIREVQSKVVSPLFFICSDNVEFVLEHLIDATKYNFVIQPPGIPVHYALSLMTLCKHFVIGNTTFGWWAQYLSKEKGVVVAPSRWMLVDMPIDLYQDDWCLIKV